MGSHSFHQTSKMKAEVTKNPRSFPSMCLNYQTIYFGALGNHIKPLGLIVMLSFCTEVWVPGPQRPDSWTSKGGSGTPKVDGS